MREMESRLAQEFKKIMDFSRSLFRLKGKEWSKVGNSQLVQAMHDVALADTAENRKKLYNLLLTATIFIPTPEIPSDLKSNAANPAGGTTKVDIIGLTGKKNQSITPIFTDMEALRNWDPNIPALTMPARAFFQMIGTLSFDEVIINPFDPIRKMLRPGGVLMRFEFAALAQGFIPGRPDASGPGIPMTFPKGQDVAIGAASEQLRDEVLDLVLISAKTVPIIEELYFFYMVIGNNGGRNVIGVDLSQKVDQEMRQKITRTLAMRAQPLLQKGEYLDFLIMDSPLADTIRQRGKRLLHPER
jgi:hypothetical protein